MEAVESPIYKNLISHIDVNRSVNSTSYFNFKDINSELVFSEFLNDINTNNDTLELNLIKNNAYKEAIVMSLNINTQDKIVLSEMIKDEQKTFGGSKLFYFNDDFDKILVVAVSKTMEGKLNMVLNRLNKINEKISRLNLKIKRENAEAYTKRHGKDKKDILINMINNNLKV